ncbi:ThuA domain-containing protein [Pseudactinotalea suaedae]|uniref:ThuA domain-containing protein n=1 Tax=Pseudactinotalea suaedae TaxID=1524924 RepID=UPI0012E12BA4|nr:ThuA domain-containing protein [Pseudactinotalea suaedae]
MVDLDVVVLSGEGRYADPWHDFPGTSARIAEILRAEGLTVQVCGSDSTAPVPARLVVVNAGGGADAIPGEGDRGSQWRDAVLDHALAGGPVLATHAATNTFYDEARWPGVLGGRWVPGTSMHPPGGPATAQVAPNAHPITAGMPAEIDVVDERYSFLEVSTAIVPLVTQVHDAVVHPIVWAHEGEPSDGATTRVRVVVDTLGHDLRAYGETRADLLRREVGWLLA